LWLIGLVYTRIPFNPTKPANTSPLLSSISFPDLPSPPPPLPLSTPTSSHGVPLSPERRRHPLDLASDHTLVRHRRRCHCRRQPRATRSLSRPSDKGTTDGGYTSDTHEDPEHRKHKKEMVDELPPQAWSSLFLRQV
uniref:Uncharacterized protein n=1 Tax=Triticum urartu TaxID=4572 RepID=A0A8R7VGF9_TRIUA